MASTSVNYTNLISQSWENVMNLIDDKDNVPDPRDSGSTRKMIYTREPDRGLEFKGYPLIVISTSQVDFGKPCVGANKRRVDWEIIIEIYSSDDIPERRGKGQEYMREIANNIIKTLNDVTNRKTLRNYGMANITPNLTAQDVSSVDQELIYISRFTIPFSKYLVVSA